MDLKRGRFNRHSKQLVQVDKGITMITTTEFVKLIENIKKHSERCQAIYKASEGLLCLIDLNTHSDIALGIAMSAIFTKEIVEDVIYWWICEPQHRVIYNQDKTIYKELKTVNDLYDYCIEIKDFEAKQ